MYSSGDFRAIRVGQLKTLPKKVKYEGVTSSRNPVAQPVTKFPTNTAQKHR